MITRYSLSIDWIEDVRNQHPKKDPLLIEKMVRALKLVEELKLTGLEFAFKGGTALSVLLGSVIRFSTDIDIVVENELILEPYLNKVIEQNSFSRWEESVRDSKIPKKHFKLFYTGVVQEREEHILLDVLFEKNQYDNRVSLPLQADFLHQEGPNLALQFPSICALLGDKLTAFAPNTTGIPYRVGKSLEIAKQLFDIALLYDRCDDLEIVSKTFMNIAQQELQYRDLPEKTQEDVLLDCLQTATLIGTRGVENKDGYEEILSGFRKLSGYVLDGAFTVEEGILCAGKAALLAVSLMKNKKALIHYDSEIDMHDWKLQFPDPTKLNKLKKSNPRAFFYFMKAYEFLQS